MGFVEMIEAALPAPYVAKLDSRGRLIIRKKHREFMGLPKGGPVEWFVNSDGQLVFQAPTVGRRDD